MKTSIVNFIIIVFGIGVITYYYIPGIYSKYRTVNRLQKELKFTQLREENLKKESEELTIHLKNFNDLEFIEQFARNHLDMKKEDEVIYRVIYEEE
jgi:cell division protein FtsB